MKGNTIMKRLLAIILAVITVFSCLALSAAAQPVRISSELQEKMDNSKPEDIITAAVWFKGFNAKVSEMPGFPDYGLARKELDDLYQNDLDELIIMVFKDIDVDVLFKGPGPLAIVDIKAADLASVAKNESVSYLDIWDMSPYDGARSNSENIIIEKLNDSILNKIEESSPEEKILVYITFNGFEKSINQVPSSDIDEARLQLRIFNTAREAFLFPVIFNDTDYDVKVHSYYLSSSIIVSVKTADILKIAKYDIVKQINYSDDTTIYDTPETETKSYKYKDKFDAVYPPRNISSYDELYYHKDENNMTDWVLIKAAPSDMVQIRDWEIQEIVGNRVIFRGTRIYPFDISYGVYNVKKDRFESVISKNLDDVVADYKSFGRAYDEYGEGRLLGDTDLDDELTIIDCTLMQRCATKVRDWPDDDAIKTEIYSAPKLKYYSDFDRDGERDIVDATKLQRYVTYID